MKSKLLNLTEALQMYDLIGEFLPKEETTQIEAIHAMVVKMGVDKYFKCIELLTGESREVIISAEKNDRLSAFLVGFQENRLFELPRLKQDGLHG
jgi:hypothetical protein